MRKGKAGFRRQAIYRSNLDYRALWDIEDGFHRDYSIYHTQKGIVQIFPSKAGHPLVQVSPGGKVLITYTTIKELREAISTLQEIAGQSLRLELRKANPSSDEMRQVYSLYITGHLQHPAPCPICMEEPMQTEEKSLAKRQLIRQFISEKAQREISKRQGRAGPATSC